jgi:hypothetical protein
MFSQNGKRPILTEYKGCFPHAEFIVTLHTYLKAELVYWLVEYQAVSI